jgi:thiamine kinase-like enzyme
MINTIIFDLARYLVDWNPDYMYRTCLPMNRK